MSIAFRLLTALFGRRIAHQTKEQLRTVVHEHTRATRSGSSALLRRLAAEPGPHVVVGQTKFGENVSIPTPLLVTGWGLISGASGGGKSMLAAMFLQALLEERDGDVSAGLLDAKGEAFERALFSIGRLLETLPPAAAVRLRERLVIIDFSSPDPLAAYNFSLPWSGADLDFFATSRTTTLEELFPTTDAISLRASSILKHTIKLLAEQSLPFSYADRVLSSDPFRSRLLTRAQDEDIKHYFESHFAAESRSTIAALRGRLNATLFGSGSLRLALSGTTAPDFGALMDAGAIILVNCGGTNIPRATARTLQAIVLSDLRHAVFNRRGRNIAWWLLDEAQHLFRTKYLREHMTDLLTMSRSFKTHGALITQNLSTAVQDSTIFEIIHTNAKWSFVFRGSPKDAAFMQSALPVSGRLSKPKSNPYASPEFYSLSEERTLMLNDIAHLPDREAWLWMKSLTGEALRVRTRTIEIPTGNQFHDAVEAIRGDPSLGRRQSRTAYLAEIARLDATWQTSAKHTGRDLTDDLTDLFRAYEETDS